MSGIIKLKLNAIKPVEILYKKFWIGFSGLPNPHVKIVWCTNASLRLEPKQRALTPQLAAGLASESKIKAEFLNGGRFPAACCRVLFKKTSRGLVKRLN
jgi:hypothetical protein